MAAPPPAPQTEGSVDAPLSPFSSAPSPRADKESKAKMEKILEIRELTTQIMNIKR